MRCRMLQVLQQIKSDLAQHLDPQALREVCQAAGHRWRQRRLDPLTTIQLFVLQVLHGNTAVNHLRHWSGLAFTASAYCPARGRLPGDVLPRRLQRVGHALPPATHDEGRWRGHRVFHRDGSSFSMPDTPELQEKFGQPGGQRAGGGFPVAHLLTLFPAGTGFLLPVLAAPLRTHDLAQVAAMHPELQAGDVLVGDRAFCSCAHFAPYAALPESLVLRELRYRVEPPGFRTREVTLVTTLGDVAAYPAEALAQLYRQRWQVEINLRHLKQTMEMDVLRCETALGVLKELTVFALVYNLVRVVMCEAARRQGVAVERISFVDALRWLADAEPGSPLPDLVVNPERPDRVEPRAIKRRPKEYDRLNRPRQELRNRLLNKEVKA